MCNDGYLVDSNGPIVARKDADFLLKRQHVSKESKQSTSLRHRPSLSSQRHSEYNSDASSYKTSNPKNFSPVGSVSPFPLTVRGRAKRDDIFAIASSTIYQVLDGGGV
mmetsp:Transcript_26129/g.41189  ORF Transcript_26129/g.41189 Transcript_26129/m.41189 type:complete len:108 (+) Transcript_26129:823-1146(+)